MRAVTAGACAGVLLWAAADARAQCTEQIFQNVNGPGQVACPCFVAGEQAGAVFQLPASAYPIEITRVGIGWGSQFGGTGQSVEAAINIYGGGLPSPGSPIFSLVGPQLTDGVVNEFNLAPIPGEIIVNSGPFMVALEFYNENAGNFFAPSIVHDGNGCQSGKNTVYSGGVWFDACALGVTGDWVIYVKYRSLNVTAATNTNEITFSGVPAYQTTCDTLVVSNTGCDTLTIAGIEGCDAAPFSVDSSMTSHIVPPGGQTPIVVCVTPTGAGSDNCTLTVTSNASNGPIVVDLTLDGVTAVPGIPRNGFEITGVVPNPFNPETTIRFVIPREMPVTAEVWSVSGARVRTLADGRTFAAGENALRWDGRNAGGQPVASGVYLIRVKTQVGQRVTRAVLLE
ncbi:MAG TPA: FlgD immunoglobulin-like domain containing protein [Candidatus Krumholzibacteria bacterium]|nr:FlgD immunoglobulin-like domain containing protein [Candidatus Krumholzibacteria bacterium]